MTGSPRVDLHVHSDRSDGTLSPAALAERAARLGLAALALTDHDSVEGVRACAARAGELGLRCIPAVELSTRIGTLDAHLLGYFVDPDSASLVVELERLRRGRRRRIERMAARLREAGYDVPFQTVLELAHGGSVGRAHLARALVRGEHVPDVPTAFDELIGKGRPFWEPGDLPEPAYALATIREAGGLPVLAHPALSGVVGLIPELAAQGLAGVEAYHAEHTPAQRVELAQTAERLGLLVTGGSDYHGPGGRSPEMGSVELPEGAYERLLAAAGE